VHCVVCTYYYHTIQYGTSKSGKILAHEEVAHDPAIRDKIKDSYDQHARQDQMLLAATTEEFKQEDFARMRQVRNELGKQALEGRAAGGGRGPKGTFAASLFKPAAMEALRSPKSCCLSKSYLTSDLCSSI
jgi:hypothetical protein